MRRTVNKDGSVTTTDEDAYPASGDAEAKVVEPAEEKPAAKTRGRAESK